MGGKAGLRGALEIPDDTRTSFEGLVQLLGEQRARRAVAGELPNDELLAADPEVRMGHYLLGSVHAFALARGITFRALSKAL